MLCLASIRRLSLLLPLLLAACAIPAPPGPLTPIVPIGPADEAPRATMPPQTAVYLRPVAGEASSFDNTPGFAPSPDPMNAADGDLGTRWASRSGLDNQWIYFDLGKSKTLDHVRIFWEEAFATAYEIQVSDDALDWRTITRLENQEGGLDEVRFAAQQGRHVRLLVLARKVPEWGASIWEFEIYGPAAANPEDRPYAEVFKATPSPAALPLASPAAGLGRPGESRQAGVNYTSWRELEYMSPQSDDTLRHLSAGGVNAVALVPTWFQDDLHSVEIAPWPGRGGRTPQDAALAHAINTAHQLGMRVMLKPHLDGRTTSAARGQIRDPRPEWFSSYRRFIGHYARLAQTYNVELFCVGTELDDTMPGHEEQWRELIREVRALYSGDLTYAANWPGYAHVPLWPELDYIAIDAYWPVTEKLNPTEQELLAGWRGIADNLERWRAAQKLDKPLIFAELGYRSAEATNRQFAAPPSDNPAPEQQAAVLRATLTAMAERPWFKGLYYWNYLPEPAVADPAGFTIRGKPAEAVLFQAYRSWSQR